MKKIKEVLIVEGVHDLSHLKSFLNADILVTGGTSLNKEFWDNLEAFRLAKRDFVIMTDADSPGEFIRKEISKVIPSVKHVFVDARNSKYKSKVGIEHASKEIILEALNNVVSFDNKIANLNAIDLFDLGLTAQLSSKSRRDFIASKLKLGPSNGKTFLSRLNGLGITKDQLKELLLESEHENK